MYSWYWCVLHVDFYQTSEMPKNIIKQAEITMKVDLLRKYRIYDDGADKDWLEVNFTEHWLQWSRKITLTGIIGPDIATYC